MILISGRGGMMVTFSGDVADLLGRKVMQFSLGRG